MKLLIEYYLLSTHISNEMSRILIIHFFIRIIRDISCFHWLFCILKIFIVIFPFPSFSRFLPFLIETGTFSDLLIVFSRLFPRGKQGLTVVKMDGQWIEISYPCSFCPSVHVILDNPCTFLQFLPRIVLLRWHIRFVHLNEFPLHFRRPIPFFLFHRRFPRSSIISLHFSCILPEGIRPSNGRTLIILNVMIGPSFSLSLPLSLQYPLLLSFFLLDQTIPTRVGKHTQKQWQEMPPSYHISPSPHSTRYETTESHVEEFIGTDVITQDNMAKKMIPPKYLNLSPPSIGFFPLERRDNWLAINWRRIRWRNGRLYALLQLECEGQLECVFWELK